VASRVAFANKERSFKLGTFFLIGGVHLIALSQAMKYFSWDAFALMIFLHWLTASVGICFGFHRFLTHKACTLPVWLAYTIAFCGTLACQNGPIKWVAHHRLHHKYSDAEGDPHNARKGFWWAHWGWLFFTDKTLDSETEIHRLAKDIADVPYYQRLEQFMLPIQVIFGIILFGIGGMPWLIWGIFVRLVLVWHSTWFVNSAAHTFGYKNFPLNDLSTNCWWVAILSYGEGWHNNHHKLGNSAIYGLRGWQIDMTWWIISFFRFLGVAHDCNTQAITQASTWHNRVR